MKDQKYLDFYVWDSTNSVLKKRQAVNSHLTGEQHGGKTICVTEHRGTTIDENGRNFKWLTDTKRQGTVTPCNDDTGEFIRLDAITSISVQTNPTKVVYTVGTDTAWDMAGLVIKCAYLSGSTTKYAYIGVENLQYSISDFDDIVNGENTGTQAVTLTLNAKTTTFNITVS